MTVSNNPILGNGSPAQSTGRTFDTWLVVTRGVHKTLAAYVESIRVRGYEVGGVAGQLLVKLVLPQEELGEELVLASGADLGLADGYTLAELVAAAAPFGLYPCAGDVALALRDQYDDQPMDEWLGIVMEPVVDSGRRPRVLVVERDSDGVWIASYCVYPETGFYAAVWVFSRRPPAAIVPA